MYLNIDSYIRVYNNHDLIITLKNSLWLRPLGRLRQLDYSIPDEYKDLDIVNYLMEKAKTQTHTIHQLRTEAELKVYEERGLLDLLRFLVYFVETMRNHNIVWGVGRGSSVASYVLYLIGIHKVDSIKYDLDINEFLR